MRFLRHLLAFGALLGVYACLPVSRVSPSQAPPLVAIPTASPRTLAAESTREDSSTPSTTYQVFAVVAQDAGAVIVRAGPGVDFPVVAELKVGEGAPVVGRTPQSDWLKLDLGGTTAWVYAPVVNIVANPTGVPLVPTPTLPAP